MNLFTSAVLGVLQGLTEFLPVSSSGHLVLVQSLIPNFSQQGVLYDVFLHLGTLLAVLIFFRKLIFKMTLKYLLFLLLATIPAALVGYFLRSPLETLFTNVKLVGLALMITGVLNLLTDEIKIQTQKLSFKNAFITGIFQAIAIIPGISRSGSTIFAATAQGIKREKAAEFSFLLSVPAVIGANILEATRYNIFSINNLPLYLIGFVFAFFSGILAIYLVFKFLNTRRFKIFAFYCFVLGAIVLLI